MTRSSPVTEHDALVRALQEIIQIDRVKVLANGVQIRDEDGTCAKIARSALHILLPQATEQPHD